MMKFRRLFILLLIVIAISIPAMHVSAQMPGKNMEPGFSEEFSQNIWENGWDQRILIGNPAGDYFSQTDNRLSVKIPGSDGSVILTNDFAETDDSYVEAVFENILSMEASYGVICRYSEDGWYEFRIYVSGPRSGAYTFFKYDASLKSSYKNPYVEVHAGYTQYNSMDIQLGLNKKNKLGLNCEGNNFRLFINNKEQKHYKSGEITDRTFSRGKDGVIFQTYGNNIAKLDLLSFAAYGEGILSNQPVATVEPTAVEVVPNEDPAEVPTEAPRTDAGTRAIVARPLGAPPIEEPAPVEPEVTEAPEESVIAPEENVPTEAPMILEEAVPEEIVDLAEAETTAEYDVPVQDEAEMGAGQDRESRATSAFARLLAASFMPLQVVDAVFPPLELADNKIDPEVLSDPIPVATEIPPTATMMPTEVPPTATPVPTEIPPTPTPLPPTATPVPTEFPPAFFSGVQVGQKISCADKFQFSIFWQPVMTRSLSGENAKGRYLYFRAQIENKSGQDLAVLPARSIKLFGTIDGIQKEFSLNTAISAMTSHRWSVDLLTKSMEHGKTLDTFLVFEVPENGTGWTVEFQPIAKLADGPFCRIQLELPKLDRQDL